eukprot:COSAG02_NODE_890_length_16155_cov_63.407885_2_plen_92_part_00
MNERDRGAHTERARELTQWDTLCCVAADQKMIRCDLATDWAFADKNAPLYAHMESMDRLPIPEVTPTLELYLHSVRPFLTEQEFDAYKVRL